MLCADYVENGFCSQCFSFFPSTFQCLLSMADSTPEMLDVLIHTVDAASNCERRFCTWYCSQHLSSQHGPQSGAESLIINQIAGQAARGAIMASFLGRAL